MTARGNVGRACRAVKVLLTLTGWLCITGAHADTSSVGFQPKIWLSPGVYSWHFDRSKKLRNDNVGLGVEFAVAADHAVMAGSLINSNGARTRYAAYAWRPLHSHLGTLDLAAGAVLGAFDGYPNYKRGGWFVAPLPLVSFEGRRFGINLSVIPTLKNRVDGALSIQIKLRIR